MMEEKLREAEEHWLGTHDGELNRKRSDIVRRLW